MVVGTEGGGSERNGVGGGLEPPQLASLSPAPVYDLTTVVQFTGVRVMTLWAWEQQLGFATPPQESDQAAMTGRKYSERDLVALLWVRDEVLMGATPDHAILRLLRAQPSLAGAALGYASAPGGTPAGGLARAHVNTGPLPSSRFTAPLRHASVTRQLYGERESRTSDAPGSAPYLQRTGPAGVLTHDLSPPRQTDVVTPGFPPESLQRGVPSHPFWMGQGVGASSDRELHNFVNPLVRAFAGFDTAAANRVLGEALEGRSVEMVCANLLQPTLARVGNLWAHQQLTSPEYQYALTYAREFLFWLLHGTVESADAPLAIVGCGPKETYDIHALLLAVFWRRAGLHVAFLGADVDGVGLVQETGRRHPAVVALMISSSSRVRALARVSKDIQQLPGPRPVFAYGGPVFVRNQELRRRVQGVYLGDDVAQATWHVKRLLNIAV